MRVSSAITRWTFDILREASEMMTSRAIAMKIVEEQGVDVEDTDKVERIKSGLRYSRAAPSFQIEMVL